MTSFSPLALRLVRPDWADRVPSPAHDSLTPEQRRAFHARNPDSYLAVTRSPEDLPAGSALVGNDELLALGRAALERLIDAGAFSDEHPARFYAYRLEAGGHAQTGLVGGVALDDYAAGELRVHEQVRADRTDHLARHLGVVGAQSSPIAIAHRPNESIAGLLDRVTVDRPLVTACGSDGLEQWVWPITDQDDERTITETLASMPTYIVDGHHRASAALAYHQMADTEASSRILVAAFSADLLLNRAFHRWVRRTSLTEMIEVIDRDMTWRYAEHDELEARATDEVVLYGDGRWVLVRLPVQAGIDIETNLSNLDPVRLEQQLLRSHLGIDPRAAGGQLTYVPGNRPLDELTHAIDLGGGVLCVSRPVTVELLLDAADAGLVMPPKSTYFEPKVRSGVFVRSTIE